MGERVTSDGDNRRGETAHGALGVEPAHAKPQTRRPESRGPSSTDTPGRPALGGDVMNRGVDSIDPSLAGLDAPSSRVDQSAGEAAFGARLKARVGRAVRKVRAPSRRVAGSGASSSANIPLIRIGQGRTVFACIAGTRIAFKSMRQLKREGFDPELVKVVSIDDSRAQLPEARPVSSPPPRFQTLDQYLARAITDPNLVAEPFDQYDERVIAYMDWNKRALAREHRNVAGPKVTVIVPTYQRAATISRAVSSILEQSYSNLEVIVVDDGGNDDTETVVRELSDERVVYVRHTTNQGNAAARNTGMQMATGEWLAYLDSDDFWDRDFVRVLLGEALRNSAHFVYGAQRVVREPGESGHRHELVRFAPFHRGLLENANYISMIAVLHRRSLIDAVGPMDVEMKRFVDWEFFLRLSEVAKPLAVPAVLSTYDQQQSSGRISTDESKDVHIQAVGSSLRTGRLLSHHLLSDDAWSGDVGHLIEGLYAQRKQAEPEQQFRETSIVIPSYEAADYLRACLWSLRTFTPSNTQIIVVDNGSGPDVHFILDQFREQYQRSMVIRNSENLGFTRAVNQGIEASGDNCDIVLMNNDALVTPGWLEALQAVPQHHSEVGLVAPQQVLLPGTKTIRTHVPGARKHSECDTTLSAHHGNVVDPMFDPLRGYVELNYAAFFCVLITREALDVCGLLDHETGAHYRSDRVYCDAVRSFGKLKILYTPDSKVYHFHGRSTEELDAADPNFSRLMKISKSGSEMMGGSLVP